jgi:uncharacterized DUF497 family protein
MIKISYDPGKREATLARRRIDFEEAPGIFDGPTYDEIDDRFDYCEKRIRTMGYWDERMVVLIWTPRGETRHIISMRKANDREQARYAERLEEIRRLREHERRL